MREALKRKRAEMAVQEPMSIDAPPSPNSRQELEDNIDKGLYGDIRRAQEGFQGSTLDGYQDDEDGDEIDYPDVDPSDISLLESDDAEDDPEYSGDDFSSGYGGRNGIGAKARDYWMKKGRK
jgi:hypothetical protein